MRPLIVAEISGNHKGDLWRAQELIRAAAKCGCSAAKFQFYRPADMDDPGNPLYSKFAIPPSWIPELFETAERARIPLFASVFAPWAVRHLNKYNCWAFKIASPESTRLTPDVYKAIANEIQATGKRFIVSSGRSDWHWAQSLNPDLLFYCVAGYPASPNDHDIEFVNQVGGIGFSDHSQGLVFALAMLRAGAVAIEKHFMIEDDCIDRDFSLNTEQMQTLCRIASR